MRVSIATNGIDGRGCRMSPPVHRSRPAGGTYWRESRKLRMPTPQRFISRPAVLLVTIASAILLAAEPAVREPDIHVVVDKAGRPVAFEARGLPAAAIAKLAGLDDAEAGFAQVLSVYVVGDSPDADQPAMAGAYTVDGSSLRFTPRYALRPGLRYRAVLSPDAIRAKENPEKSPNESAAKSVSREVAVPEAAGGIPTEITHVYPSAATLPENQLRFYIHFSAPMGRGEAYDHIHLLDSHCTPVDLPFLEIGEELWDRQHRRLTLLVDPGRIKRGLKPREDLGPVFEAGREYTLVVDRVWRDAAGRALKSEFKKQFRAGPPVETAIDPASWKIGPAAAGSSGPVVVTFSRPLDHALMERTITVTGADGTPIVGRARAEGEERRWEFRPERPWNAGKYQLVIDTTLEDIAGNRIGRAFEVEDAGPVDKRAQAETVRVPFEISP
jgi:hypothetical protein